MSRIPSCHVNVDWPFPKLPLGTPLAAVGSCFAQDIVGRLLAAGFPGAQNPNGIAYNAASLAESMERVADGPSYSEADFFLFEGLWSSWSHHGSFSSAALTEAVVKAEIARIGFRAAVEACGLFIATPASSVVYEHIECGRVVANCHKIPNEKFKRRVLSAEENLSALTRLVDAVRRLNPRAPIVFTLSPVRHYPGDLVLNARSKANLLSAIHVCRENSRDVRYFPAYELVIDELRDYRFFKEDMLHPNETATEIVLEVFAGTCFEEGVKAALARSKREAKAASHRSLRN